MNIRVKSFVNNMVTQYIKEFEDFESQNDSNLEQRVAQISKQFAADFMEMKARIIHDFDLGRASFDDEFASAAIIAYLKKDKRSIFFVKLFRTKEMRVNLLRDVYDIWLEEDG